MQEKILLLNYCFANTYLKPKVPLFKKIRLVLLIYFLAPQLFAPSTATQVLIQELAKPEIQSRTERAGCLMLFLTKYNEHISIELHAYINHQVVWLGLEQMKHSIWDDNSKEALFIYKHIYKLMPIGISNDSKLYLKTQIHICRCLTNFYHKKRFDAAKPRSKLCSKIEKKSNPRYKLAMQLLSGLHALEDYCSIKGPTPTKAELYDTAMENLLKAHCFSTVLRLYSKHNPTYKLSSISEVRSLLFNLIDQHITTEPLKSDAQRGMLIMLKKVLQTCDQASEETILERIVKHSLDMPITMLTFMPGTPWAPEKIHIPTWDEFIEHLKTTS